MPDSKYVFPTTETVHYRFPTHTNDLIMDRSQAATSEAFLVYLSVDCFLGGRPTAEPTWESHVRVMCRTNGWDFDSVRKDGA
jgi:hypothetical protein